MATVKISPIRNNSDLDKVIMQLRLRQLPLTLEAINAIRGSITTSRLDENFHKVVEREFAAQWKDIQKKNGISGWNKNQWGQAILPVTKMTHTHVAPKVKNTELSDKSSEQNPKVSEQSKENKKRKRQRISQKKKNDIHEIPKTTLDGSITYSTELPSLALKYKFDVDNVIQFFLKEGSSFNILTHGWIEDTLKREKQTHLLEYYKKQVGIYLSHLTLRRNKWKKKAYTADQVKLNIENVYRKINLYTKQFFILDVGTIKGNAVIAMPHALATMVAKRECGIIQIRNTEYLKEGDWIWIYSTKMTSGDEIALKANTLWSKLYYNAQIMGLTPPTKAYIGRIQLGKREDALHRRINKVDMLDEPVSCNIDDIPRRIKDLKTHKPEMKGIVLLNRCVYVPICIEMFGALNNKRGQIKLYWEDYFKYTFSLGTNSYASDAIGLYDVIFYNGRNKKRFHQMDEKAICGVKINGHAGIMIDLGKLLETSIGNTTSNVSSFNVMKKVDWVLDWNCVRFKHRYIYVYPPQDGTVNFKPLAISVPASLESFNYLKEYLNSRLSPIHCSVERMNLEILDTIRLNEAIGVFVQASRQTNISVSAQNVTSNKITPQQMSFNAALSKAMQMTPEDFQVYKSKYIDLLVKMQSSNHKVIPCVERLAYKNSDTTEYAFMFTVKCRDSFLVVYENVNPDRSTLLFRVKTDSYNQSIREIYDFLRSAETNKRSNIREKNIDVEKSGVLHYRSINHDDFSTWENKIKLYKYM